MGSRLFGYNSGATVSGASQSGSLAISNDFRGGGSVQWWNGPDENLGYVIGYTDTTGLRKANGALIVDNAVGFMRTLTKTDADFLSLSNSLTNQGFMTASAAVNWLNTNGYYTSYSASSVDTDAQAFINAAGITDPTQQTAINTLVVGLKADSLWTKMQAIYPIVGGSASQHKYNLKDPRDLDAAFRLQFNGGITHSANGMLPNGGYANTYFLPSTQIANEDSFHFSVYSRTSLGEYDVSGDIGASIIIGTDPDSYVDGETNAFYFIGFYSNTTARHGFYGSVSSFDDPVPNAIGFYVANRNSAGNVTTYKNGVLKNTGSASPSGLAYCPMLLMAMSVYYPDLYPNPNDWGIGYPGKRQLAFATIGTGLSNTDNTNLYTRIQAFQTTLGRNV